MEANNKQFRRHYGSSPSDLATMWYDLTTTNIPAAKLNEKENSEKGFKMFMVAHFFLWTYPKNSSLLASRFGMCERVSRGAPLWKWIMKIAALKEKKIKWDGRLDDIDTEVFILSVDGIDFRIWEKKHLTLPRDDKLCSHKFNSAAAKYEIGISILNSKVVWINGPFPGGKNDLIIFREGLKAKMRRGKMGIADRGYVGEQGILATPNNRDPKELKNFKSRIRSRHETFNSRIKSYKCLDDTFRHGGNKQKIALEAVIIAVQYQMDNGAPLFAA